MDLNARLLDLIGRDGVIPQPAPAQGTKIVSAVGVATAAPSALTDGYPTTKRFVTPVAYCAGGGGSYQLTLWVLFNGVWAKHSALSSVAISTATYPAATPYGKTVAVAGERWYAQVHNFAGGGLATVTATQSL